MTDETTTINIDAGGTFTDGFFTVGGTTVTAKVPTTEHDLTVCFVECIEKGADKLERSMSELLSATDVVRFSTTVGTNAVIEKSGPRLGVLVTAGEEDALYGDGNTPTVIDRFVEREMVRGIDEEVTKEGEVIGEPDPVAVADTVKELQENGARIVVIALRNSYANRANEVAVKRAIEDEYPRHYLGAVPTLAAFEVSARPDDYGRLNTVTVNAYIHRTMKTTLYRAEDKVRSGGYRRPLFIGHSSGGVARVAKTVALNTYNSGPAAGVLGAVALSRLYDHDIIATDMGGTSIDISAARDGEFDLQLSPVIDELPTHIPAIDVGTAGAGGGSIASVQDGELTVGPQSAGANPGPASFGRGGQDATVTDADVVLGRINPDYFLGGSIDLDADRARAAIVARVAEPLGIEVEEAALRIATRIEETIASAVRDIVGHRADVVAAYGGAGPVHAAGYTSRLDIDRVLISPNASVFSAFGESTMDIVHSYSQPLLTFAPDAIERGLSEMRSEAEKDMRAEGFSPGDIAFGADLLVHEGRDTTVYDLSYPFEGSVPDVDQSTCSLRLHATGGVPQPSFEASELTEEIKADARETPREVYWRDGYVETPVYRLEPLRPGNEVEGPAIIEAIDTTITVPSGHTFVVNEYDHGVIQ